MKKVWILLIIFLCPLVIKAENITNYYINATLNSNGDLLVEEYIELKENTNYFERNIYYKDNTLKVPAYDNFIEYNKLNNGSSIQFLTIGSIPKVKNNTEEITGVKEFSKTNVAHTGDTNIYILRNDEDKDYLRIYKDDNNAYYLKYVIKDLAVKYNDIGEIYFNILKNNPDRIKNLKITINLPNNNKAYSFTKGKNVKKVINNNFKISYQYKDIKEQEDIKLRILFNKDIVNNSLKENNTQTLAEILSFEKQNSNIIKNINKFLGIIITILIIINYFLLVIYTRLSIIGYKDILNILKEKISKKNIIYMVLSLIIIIGLIFLRVLGITLLISSIIISSYIINRNKKDNKIKYLSIMYILIMLICTLNLVRVNNIIYLILSIADIISLYSLSLKKLK
mgnify:FL=1